MQSKRYVNICEAEQLNIRRKVIVRVLDYFKAVFNQVDTKDNQQSRDEWEMVLRQNKPIGNGVCEWLSWTNHQVLIMLLQVVFTQPLHH